MPVNCFPYALNYLIKKKYKRFSISDMSIIILDNDYSNTRSSLYLMFFGLVLERIWTQPEKLVLLMPNACAARAIVITFISN